MSTKDILTKARDILIERGIERGGWYINTDECQVCSMGAIYLAAGGRVESHTYTSFEYDPELGQDVEVDAKDVTISGFDALAVKYAEDVLNSVIYPVSSSDVFNSVPLWNDRTKTDAEVIEAFDRAIALADN